MRVFKGIPFAAPPLGENRWKAPQPAAKWDGVRKADAFGAPCAAGPPAAAAAAAWTRRRGAQARQRPRQPRHRRRPHRRASRRAARIACTSTSGPARTTPNDRRPVMVWIYGGGFTGGSGGLAWYDGENLAAKGPVIVTFNYRLGSLGFFAHPELAKESGHNALRQLRDDGRDRRAAVGQEEHQRVRRRSEQRDDRRRIGRRDHGRRARRLAAGEGPLQSRDRPERRLDGADDGPHGAGRRPRRPTASKTMEALGVKTIAELRAKPLNELTGLSAGGLVIDGYLIPEDLSLTFMNGKQNAVDVLTGSNKDEANFGVCGGGGGRGGGAPHDRRDVQDQRAAQVRRGGRRLREAVSASRPTPTRSRRRTSRAPTRSTGTCGSGPWRRPRPGKKAYTYFFTRIPTMNGAAVAAGRDAHGGDLVRVQQPEGPGDPDVERRGHQARRHDVVVLGQLHHQGRSERQRPATLARVQGPAGRARDGARRHGAGRDRRRRRRSCPSTRRRSSVC